jgi:hypothetical protein
MSHPTSHCGDTGPEHRSTKCRACRTILQANYRARKDGKAEYDPKYPVCRACRMRFTVEPPPLREMFGSTRVSSSTVRWLENAARAFDALSDGDCWTAEDFIAWIRPDMTGGATIKDQTVGTSRQEGGAGGMRGARHTSPFPLPLLDRRSA